MAYQDPGDDNYELNYRECVLKVLHRRPVELGFALQVVEGVS